MEYRREVTRFVIIAAAIGYGYFSSSVRPFTLEANLVTLASGVAVGALMLAQHRWPSRIPSLLHRHGGLRSQLQLRRARAWLTFGGATVCFELVSLLQSPRRLHPTVSSLLDQALAFHPLRWAAFSLWLLFGVWMVTR